MKLYNYILSSLLFFSYNSSGSTSCSSLTEINWILGSWISESSKRTYIEHWNKLSKNTYEGHSTVTSAEGANIGYESLRLLNMSGEIFYLAKVPENKLPVAFKLTSCSSNSLHFENSTHDFPKSIKYLRKGNNKLEVLVGGEGDSGFKLVFRRG